MAFTLEELEAKLKANPFAREFYDLAAAYQKLGRLDDAKKICERGLEKYPGNFQARLLLTQILIAEGKFKEAKMNVDKVLMVVPDNITANYLAGDICFSLGDKAAALKFYKVVELFEPGKRDVVDKIAEIERPPEPAKEALPKESEEVTAEPPETLPEPPQGSPVAVELEEPPAIPEPPAGDTFLAEAGEPLEVELAEMESEEMVPVPVPQSPDEHEAGEIGSDTLDSLLSEAVPASEEQPEANEPSVWQEEPSRDKDVSVPAEAGVSFSVETEEEGPVKEDSAGLSTLTIAELYEKQGYPEKAVEVYQHILLREPERKDIRIRIEKLKDIMLGLEPEGDVAGRDIKSAIRRKRIEVLGTWLRKIKEEGNV